MTLTQLLLMLHLFCVAMALGIGFSNIVGFRVARREGGEKASGIAAQREALLIYTDIFAAGLVVTGLTLLWAIGGPQNLRLWFHAKMAAVVLWALSYVLLRLRVAKFLKGRDSALLPLIRFYAHTAITGATLALIFAVLTFAA